MSSRKEPEPRGLAPSDFTPSTTSLSTTSNLYNPFSPNINPQYDSPSVDNGYTSVPIPGRGHGKLSKKGTMDPFEVRVRFTQHLQHLNASVTSANKAAQYAIKYRDMDEDLHSCILEQLERVSFWSCVLRFWVFEKETC
jgi:hypothetical protein